MLNYGEDSHFNAFIRYRIIFFFLEDNPIGNNGRIFAGIIPLTKLLNEIYGLVVTIFLTFIYFKYRIQGKVQ